MIQARSTAQAWTSLTCTTSTSTSAPVCSLTPSLTTYTDGQWLSLSPHATLSANATLNVDTLGARKLYKMSSGTPAQIGASDVLSTGKYLIGYSSALDGGTGGWLVVPLEGGSGSYTQTCTANAQTGTTYVVLTGDRAKCLTMSNASTITVSLPQAGTGFEDGWYMFIKNIGAGDVTVAPTTSTISGAASITMSIGEWALIRSDGTNYEAYQFRTLAGSNITLTKARNGLTIATSSGGDVVGPASATGDNLASYNSTTGKLIKDSGLPSASTGTGDMVRKNSPTLVTPALGTPSALVLTNAIGLPIAGGGTGGTTAATARGALGITQSIQLVNAAVSNPADATTYYVPWSTYGLSTTEVSSLKYSSSIAGTITKMTYTNANVTTAGSNENVTVTLRINGADTAITGTMTWDGSTSNLTVGTFTGSVVLAVGDVISIKVVTPTWATNPVGVRSVVVLTVLMDK